MSNEKEVAVEVRDGEVKEHIDFVTNLREFAVKSGLVQENAPLSIVLAAVRKAIKVAHLHTNAGWRKNTFSGY